MTARLNDPFGSGMTSALPPQIRTSSTVKNFDVSARHSGME